MEEGLLILRGSPEDHGTIHELLSFKLGLGQEAREVPEEMALAMIAGPSIGLTKPNITFRLLESARKSSHLLGKGL